MAAPLHKPSEVAQILRISPSFAYQLMREGILPTVRIGAAVRVRPQDLEAFIQNNVTGQEVHQLTSTKSSTNS